MGITYFSSRCRQLNDIIKKLVFLNTYEPEPSEDYNVANNTLYTVSEDTVSGSTVIINSGRASVSGDTITFN